VSHSESGAERQTRVPTYRAERVRGESGAMRLAEVTRRAESAVVLEGRRIWILSASESNPRVDPSRDQFYNRGRAHTFTFTNLPISITTPSAPATCRFLKRAPLTIRADEAHQGRVTLDYNQFVSIASVHHSLFTLRHSVALERPGHEERLIVRWTWCSSRLARRMIWSRCWVTMRRGRPRTTMDVCMRRGYERVMLCWPMSYDTSASFYVHDHDLYTDNLASHTYCRTSRADQVTSMYLAKLTFAALSY
jgi:hypothetical protein